MQPRGQNTRQQIKALQNNLAEQGSDHAASGRLIVLVGGVRRELYAEPAEDRRQYKIADQDKQVGHRTYSQKKL